MTQQSNTTEFNSTSRKGHSPEQIQKNSQRIKSDAEKFARSLLKEALNIDDAEIDAYGMIQMGPIKTEEAIIRKGENAYDGDYRKIADGCRLQILPRDAKDLEKVMTVLEREYKYALSKHDTESTQRNDAFKCSKKVRYLAQRNDDGDKELIEFKDHITKPKKWGWMGAMVKLEATSRNGLTVPFEVQIFPKRMKDGYDETHKLYSTIKSDVEDWERYCDLHDTIQTYADAEKAATEHPHLFNPAYKKYQNLNGKTDIGTFFQVIRNNEPYNITKERNNHVLETLKDVIRIHKQSADACGLLEAKRFTQGHNAFPELKDADASIKELEIEPLEGYEEMQRQSVLERLNVSDLADHYTPEELEIITSMIEENSPPQPHNTPSPD